MTSARSCGQPNIGRTACPEGLPILITNKLTSIASSTSKAEEINLHGNGTGPYVQDQFVPGDPIKILRKNGSPDRVESRLVPEAGYELDTFRVSGIPRHLGLDLLRSLAQAATGFARPRQLLYSGPPH